MSVEDGFDELQANVNACAEAVDKARARRDTFKAVLSPLDDVGEVFPSGSLARGTHCDPIHDVDLVVVFKAGSHEGWGDDGPSAEEALEYARRTVKKLLGVDAGRSEQVRRADLKNHSVKCFLDDPGADDAFTVDVTPALAHPERGLWIPEKNSEKWVRSDPEHMIKITADRHAEWNEFAKLVRVLKRWNIDHGKHMKSLVIEVLAQDHLPVASRPEALAQFFQAATVAIHSPVCDPADLCGEIQPDMDTTAALEKLDKAADLAWRAVDLANNHKGAQAMCKWRELFGNDLYPEPPGGCGGDGAGLIGGAGAVGAQPKRPIRNVDQG